MSKRIKLATMLLLFLTGGLMQSFAHSNQSVNLERKAPTDVIIWLDTVMGHSATWPSMTGNTPYQVTLINMTTGTLHSSFFTSNTSTLFTGLVSGNSYRISVSRGSYTIIDIIDIG